MITDILFKLDKRYKSASGKYPVKIWISFRRENTLRLPTGHFYDEKEFRKLIKEKGPAYHELLVIQRMAEKIRADEPFIDSALFRHIWKNFDNSARSPNVSEYLRQKVDQVKKLNKSHLHFQYAQKQIAAKYPHLRFSAITTEWLNQYWRDFDHLSISSRSRVLRAIRAVYYEAHKAKVFYEAENPWAGYKIRTESKLKIPLPAEDIERLKADFYSRPHLKYNPVRPDPEERQTWAVAMWLFSNQCNGMNPIDMAMLQYKAFSRVEGFLVYNRHKTRGTEVNVQEILIPTNQLIRDIVARYGRPTLNPNDFVFDILPWPLPYEELRNKINQFCKNVNKWTARAAERLGIRRFRFDVARHSYANAQINAGTPLDVIQYNLGHSSPKTTQTYTGSFKLEILKKAGEKR